MQLKYGVSIPELSLGQVLNIAVGKANRIYLSTLTGPISGPQNQLLVTLEYSELLGRWIKVCSLDNLAQIHYPTPVDLANIGLEAFYVSELGQEGVCIAAPEYDFPIGNDGGLACSTNPCEAFTDIKQVEQKDSNPAPYPEDVAVGLIKDPNTGIYDRRAYVVNAKSNSRTMITGLLTPEQLIKITKWTEGTTPVAAELRRSDDPDKNNDKLYIVNMNSKDDPINPDNDEVDIASVHPYLNEIKGRIKGIAYEFHPKSIAITKVISAKTFLEAARATIEEMADSDFTTASKRQVLLNKLNNIEVLLGTPANEQAIISNTEAFKNQVDNFVVNEQRKEELIQYADALIKYIE
jgi:hypothetical protein